MPSYLLIFSSTVIIEITLISFKQLQMLFKTRLWWFREKHNIISDPHQSLLLSFIKFSTFSYLHEKVYFGISEPHRKVWSYHKRPTSTENCEGRFMGSYFFMRVAWARRRRAATLMKKYEPMMLSLMVFGGVWRVLSDPHEFWRWSTTHMSFHGGRPKMLPKPAAKRPGRAGGRKRSEATAPCPPRPFCRGFLCSIPILRVILARIESFCVVLFVCLSSLRIWKFLHENSVG